MVAIDPEGASAKKLGAARSSVATRRDRDLPPAEKDKASQIRNLEAQVLFFQPGAILLFL